MQALVDELYESFVAKVASARGMTAEQARLHATGEVFTGRRALELGLVDELGDLERAIAVAAGLAGLPVPERPQYVRARRPLRARLMGSLGASWADTLVEGDGAPPLRQAVLPAAWLGRVAPKLGG